MKDKEESAFTSFGIKVVYDTRISYVLPLISDTHSGGTL